MTVKHQEYDDLHRLIDRLRPTHVRALRAVALELVADPPHPIAQNDGQPRKLSFAGIVSDEPDVASRSEEILRDRFRNS